MINIYAGTMIMSAFLAALSQVILKLSARDTHSSKIYEYFNLKVIVGYGLLSLTMLLNTWAYQNVEYKLGPVLNATSYIFVLIMGRLLLKEKVSKKKILGVSLIVIGICVSAIN